MTLREGSLFADRYRVVRTIARGGMGTVYEAVDEKTHKRCALKLMRHEDADDQDLRRRFTNEAHVVARLENDHLIDIRDFGTDDASGGLYIAMELLRGDVLSDVMNRGELGPLEERIELLSQLFFGVAAAHAASIVHRDLKPENIFLHTPTLEGTRRIVKIIDFGIAKDLSDDGPQTVLIGGTPRWMAPEQATPLARLTTTADVWALGLLTFYVLTGKIFWSSIERATLMKEVLEAPIPDPDVRAAQIGASLPPGVAPWLLRCLEREPSRRYTDAGTAWNELAAVLADRPGLARGDGASPFRRLARLESNTRGVPSVRREGHPLVSGDLDAVPKESDTIPDPARVPGAAGSQKKISVLPLPLPNEEASANGLQRALSLLSPILIVMVFAGVLALTLAKLFSEGRLENPLK